MCVSFSLSSCMVTVEVKTALERFSLNRIKLIQEMQKELSEMSKRRGL